MMMCSRCKTRPAVIFVSTMTGSDKKSEGLCLNCAKELGLPQISEYLQQMGISEEDFDSAYDSLFGESDVEDVGKFENQPDDEELTEDDSEKEEDNLFERGGAGTMPNFLKNLFGSSSDNGRKEDESTEKKPRKKSDKTDKKRKCLETYCSNLTRKAKEGKIDTIIGRDKEIYRDRKSVV